MRLTQHKVSKILKIAQNHGNVILLLSHSGQSACPADRPFAIAHGTVCCKYPTRSVACSSGSAREDLQTTDSADCCVAQETATCVNSHTSLASVCFNHLQKADCEPLHMFWLGFKGYRSSEISCHPCSTTAAAGLSFSDGITKKWIWNLCITDISA